jgi:hypothetical protein
MKNRVSLVLIAASLAMSGAAVLAQSNQNIKDADRNRVEESAEGKSDKKIEDAIKDIYRRLEIGVDVYMDWYAEWGQKDGAYDRVAHGENGTPYGSLVSVPSDVQANNNNAFRIPSANLEVRYKINDILNARLTTEVDTQVTPGGGEPNAAFHIYLHYAYIEAAKKFGPVSVSASGGMIGTPVVGYVNTISDYRWIAENYIEQSATILNNLVLDYSADLGVKASFGIMKYVRMECSITNGAGYKMNETNSYKAFTYMATITPIKELYAVGFGRNEITTKYDYTGKKAKREYYGYGVAYTSELIKIGFNHLFPYVTTVGLDLNRTNLSVYAYPVQKRGYMLFDSWINVNLGAVIPVAPLLITGRFVYGLQRGTYQKYLTDTECGKMRRTTLYALGVGWRFNKNFRMLLGVELQKYAVIKNRVLRYAEGTAGTDFYNGGALGVGDVFVGSRAPHETKRLYIKAEVVF